MVQNQRANISFLQKRRRITSFLIIVLFFGISFNKITNRSLMNNNAEGISFNVEGIPIAEITIPIDLVFTGYEENYIDMAMMSNSLSESVYYIGIDSVWNDVTHKYDSLLDLNITLEYNFHFTTPSYESTLDTFIDTNSWNGTTSALNTTQLNLQESTGERMSIFYEQEGRAIDGEALEQYLVTNPGYSAPKPSYAIYLLNQSRFDTSDHSFEHWFEIDEEDPDSNVTADWWRLEWDNDLNPNVEFPYPCWGFQNRVFFVDPFSHQWYTKWTDIWWNSDFYEGDFDYLTADLDTYLGNNITGSSEYITHLNTYLIDYLNDIVIDVGGRGDGLLYNEREVSAQILFINNETAHGYSQEDLEWIYHEEVVEDAFEYVVPNEVATISLEDKWVELTENLELNQILNDRTLGFEDIGTYPWYNPNWTYLDGVNIFYDFQNVAENYFNMSKGDAIFTSWVILLQNVSMVAWSYGAYREYTGLGGVGNVVCYKDLNRYFASDGTTPRSGLSTLLIHEIGHVLGFAHSEITNDAIEGAGGFMSDVMSYYTIGAPDFSIFLKDSLYRTSSFVNFFRNKPVIDAYREDALHNTTILAELDQVVSDGETALAAMNYIDAFLAFRSLYKLTSNLERISLSKSSSLKLILPVMILIPIMAFIFKMKSRKRRL